MAPRNKPMPKGKPKVDPVERVLQERELEYQGAMGITNNDLRTKEAELLQIQEAYANSGLKVEGFDEFLANKHAEIKRAYRDVVSEQSYLFENDLRNYAIGKGNLLDINKTEAQQRKISQPIPGTQAHHPASVSSVESYLRNMPMAEQRRALDLLVEQGYTVGSQAKGFIPLSGPAHLGGGKKWGRAFAHVGKEGVESDPGRFKGPALPKTTTAEQAVEAMRPMLNEQIALNTAAYEHPVEKQMRAVAEKLLGKSITWMGGEAADVQAQNKEAKAMGINATTISKGFSKYPSLMETEQVPGVNIMTDVGTRVPLGMKPSEEVRRQAFATVRNPSSRLMPKTGQPIDPELVSQFSRQIGNRINRRLGKSPFDETLDTTSQKYLENIGKYQQFIDLDEASKAALGLYGENVKQYYADLNRQLRSGSTANLTPQQIAINEFLQENLTKAIDALPSEQRNLYRAIKDPAREGLTNLKVGDVYTDKGFGSFSADEKAALRFIRKDAPSALITVQNAAGTNIGPVMEFDESEFLQKPGAQYRLESIDEVFSPKTGGTVPNYRFTQVTNKPTVTAKGGTKGLMSKLGPIGAGLAIGGALLSDNPAEAIPVAAETLTPLGDLQGAPEPAVTMVNVGGKLRPLNTGTNTLMDKPGYGLEQKGGQWREVQRGTGAASRQQSKVQVGQLIPVPKPVMANTPTGVAQLKAMPKSKNIDLINEAQYFIVNPVRSAFDRIFGKRDI